MGAVFGCVVHGTRSGTENNVSEGIGTVRFCCTPNTTSYNFIIDTDGKVYELVPAGTQAWHAQELNRNWLGVALAQGTVRDRITDEQHRALRWLLQRLSADYHFPLNRLESLAGPTADRGVVEHKDTAQGRRHGKSDVGVELDWSRVL
jgi:N-acetyl-anhydromuramyl-L-alanine amidase AmpD